MTTTTFDTWLKNRIKKCRSTAEELFQDCENPEGGSNELAKAEAFDEVRRLLRESRLLKIEIYGPAAQVSSDSPAE